MSPLTHEEFVPGSRPELFQHPALFLSASVPDHSSHQVDRRPAEIRSAVTELCRTAFRLDLNLVFGGHPAISPLVLQAARRFVEPDRQRRRVIVFQSSYFKEKIPTETLELAAWDQGELLWTEARGRMGPNGPIPDEKLSLTWMRQVMTASPNLLCAVFIGGMDGIQEEMKLFRKQQRDRPCYALASTGGAAAELQGCIGGLHEGSPILTEDTSYSRVFREVFEDMNLGDRLAE